MGKNVKIKGLKELQRAIDPKVLTPRVKKHVRRATTVIGQKGAKRVRDTIKKGGFAENAALTQAIKGTDAPLIGKGMGTAGGQLRQSIKHKVTDWGSVQIGVFRTNDFFNLAYFIHEGGSIEVTDDMRFMFWYLYLTSVGRFKPENLKGRAADLWAMSKTKEFHPISESTPALIVPRRPFMLHAFEGNTFDKFAIRMWEGAIEKALKEVAK